AIVVGVQVYPDPSFGEPLRAPENDAKAFREWLVSTTGGNLLADHVELILSSDYKQPFKDARRAKPTAERIADAFEKLDAIAEENKAKGQGLRVGRRLYLYFAGHGCAPSSPSSDEALLLTANASEIRLGENIPGKMYADWYLWSAYFQEVVLFMDCCRDVFPAAPINAPANKQINRDEALDRGKIFYGFATRWKRKAREKPFNGQWRGVFTTALLTGLQGGAADPKDGRVSAASLRDYLYNSWREFLSPEDLADVEVPKEPEVWYRPQTDGEDFVFATVPVPSFPVTIDFSAELQGRKVEIIDDDFEVVAVTTLSTNSWQVDLKKGKYLLNLEAGRSQGFDVVGTGAVHVNFQTE
ncbi:MAG: caspase family protein, partial [Chloroflexota bacterium]|nr:caspase family protein [Chloroflexota bacterium]